MQFALIFIAIIIISFSASHAHPAGGKCNEPTTTERARPLQQFFKKVLNALRPTTTPAPKRNKTDWVSVATSLHSAQVQMQEIPNFVDFSSYLLSSFASNNTAIKFSYMQPNETFSPSLRGNYSVISFLVPQNDENIKSDNKTKGIFSFLSNLRLPWNRDTVVPSNTDISKFPPLLEYFTQRIQAYFSVYKYTDDSRVNNTVVIFAPGPEDFPETSVRVENDEFVDTTETLEAFDTTETNETKETTEINEKTQNDGFFETTEVFEDFENGLIKEILDTTEHFESSIKPQSEKAIQSSEKLQNEEAFIATEVFEYTKQPKSEKDFEHLEKTRNNKNPKTRELQKH